MRFSNVLISAGLLGGAAFCWTVWVSSPAGPEPARGGQRGMGTNIRSSARVPTDPGDLERFVQGSEGSQNATAWFWLAEARRERGLMGRAEEAWNRLIEVCADEEAFGDDDMATRPYYAGWAQARLGLMSDARESLGRALVLLRSRVGERPSDPVSWLRIGWCCWHLGDRDAAHEAWTRGLEQQEASISETSPRSYFFLARFRALTGDVAGAVAAFGRAVDTGWSDGALASYDPSLEPIRSRDEFQAMVRRAGEMRVLSGP